MAWRTTGEERKPRIVKLLTEHGSASPDNTILFTFLMSKDGHWLDEGYSRLKGADRHFDSMQAPAMYKAFVSAFDAYQTNGRDPAMGDLNALMFCTHKFAFLVYFDLSGAKVDHILIGVSASDEMRYSVARGSLDELAVQLSKLQ